MGSQSTSKLAQPGKTSAAALATDAVTSKCNIETARTRNAIELDLPSTAAAAQFWKDRWLWLIVAFAATLLFLDLDGRCLWEDEAETALLGRSIRRCGLPYAWDGTNLVSQEESREFEEDYLWRWSPWIQFYLAAGSMELFGDSTVGARLLFAILGLATVPLTYLLAIRLFESPVIARLSALFLAISVPFLLHARQCRWYSPAYVLTVCLVLSFVAMTEYKKRSLIGFVASAVLLWHTNFHVALGLLVGLAVAAPVLRPRRPSLARATIAFAATGILILPSYYFFLSFKVGREMFDLSKSFAQFQQYTAEYFTFMLPMPLLGVLLYRIAINRPMPTAGPAWRRNSLFLLTICGGTILYLAFGPWHFFRYMSNLLPITAILLAVPTYFILSSRRWLGIAAIGVLAFTDVFHLVPLGLAFPSRTLSKARQVGSVGPFSSPLACYLTELGKTINDPEGTIAQYLNAHAKPDDVVLVSYGELPLEFYTKLKIRGGVNGLPIPEDPDWIFLRHKVMSMVPGKDGDILRFVEEKVVSKTIKDGREVHVLKKGYRAIDLPGKDFHLGNCPEPSTHCFDTPADAPDMLLLEKRRS
jgi:hypothetical protein